MFNAKQLKEFAERIERGEMDEAVERAHQINREYDGPPVPCIPGYILISMPSYQSDAKTAPPCHGESLERTAKTAPSLKRNIVSEMKERIDDLALKLDEYGNGVRELNDLLEEYSRQEAESVQAPLPSTTAGDVFAWLNGSPVPGKNEPQQYQLGIILAQFHGELDNIQPAYRPGGDVAEAPCTRMVISFPDDSMIVAHYWGNGESMYYLGSDKEEGTPTLYSGDPKGY